MLFLQQTGLTPKQEVCGVSPRAFCGWVFDRTGSNNWANVADWLADRPLRILLILTAAFVINRLMRRVIRQLIRQVTDDPPTRLTRGLRRVRRRAPVVLQSTGQNDSLRSAARAETVGLVLRGAASAVIWSIAVLMALSEVNVNLAPLIAGAGIVGVALGFGAQSLVKDFLSGIFILIEDQFGVGDVIDAGPASGAVEAVNLRTVRLRDVEGTVWHIPNGEITRVGNKSQQWARALVDVDVAYDTDLELAQAEIMAMADTLMADDAWANIILEPPEVWGIENLGADGISIRLVIKTQPGEQWKLMREIRRRIKDRFDEAGIEIPFPQRTLWVKRDPGTSVSDPFTEDIEAGDP